MDLNLVNAILTPSNVLWVGVGLQVAAVLLCWLFAEARIARTGMSLATQPPLCVPAAMLRDVVRSAVAPMRRPEPARRGHVRSAMIERDAA